MMGAKKPAVVWLTEAGLFAALYVVLTFASSALGLAYGGVQFRLSEALCVLPAFFPSAVPGLSVGCLIANLASPYGWVDWVFGTAATLISAALAYALRSVKAKGLPMLAPIVTTLVNAIICGLEIAYFLPEGWGLSGILVSCATIGAGEFVMCFGLGLPLAYFVDKKLPKHGFFERE